MKVKGPWYLSFKQGNQSQVRIMRGGLTTLDFGAQIAVHYPLQPELGNVSEVLNEEVCTEAAILPKV